MNDNLAESFKRAFTTIVNNKIGEIKITVPAKVVSYNKLKNTVTAKLSVVKELRNSSGTPLAPPVIENIPVIFSGNSTVGIYFEPKPNDELLLMFSDLDISSFTNRGVEGNPESLRRFNINDCVAMVATIKMKPSELNADETLKIKSGSSEIVAKKDGSVLINGHLKVLA